MDKPQPNKIKSDPTKASNKSFCFCLNESTIHHKVFSRKHNMGGLVFAEVVSHIIGTKIYTELSFEKMVY